MKYKSIDVETIINECLFSEYGWHKEVWYDKSTKEFSFSGWMTQNSWNESNDDDVILVTTFNSIDLTDNDTISAINVFDIDTEGLAEEIIEKCEEFYKVNYEKGYINPKFPLINQQDKILVNLDDDGNDVYEYGIMNQKEAIDVLINIAENDGWFEDELEAIQNIQDGNYEVLEENY